MNKESTYDVAIIGGGLAGLALSILCARAGYHTILFEKEQYPFHKVCGEYISLESWNFLEELGVPLSDMQLPLINRVLISSPNGKYVESALPLGGFGISRFTLDHLMAGIARREGVTILENTKVNDVVYRHQASMVFSSNGSFEATVVAGSFGKRSNLDAKWKRTFTQVKPNPLNHLVGVKYHIQTFFPDDLIGLHNFENGYCGISKIEENKYCLCYLTTASNLRKSGNDIAEMERTILRKNPFLDKIFATARFLYQEPVTVSRISFNRKTQVENHLLMLGDAAGMITPLCGNGMSMALHSSKLAFEEMSQFLQGRINRYEMETQYTQQWEKQFNRRLQTGRVLQQFFGNGILSNYLIASLKPFPKLVSFLIRQTHGKPF
ncbi:NAD(P)/FAD-dependent oxidoreductase [Pseudoflavitalea sp. G-6-1-2]|uniref:NAD(P)/FAD-dependent oxidoreductase n=1 Tax=Pseudoflavitalea sp. G-6-1-2 TaxID=2728841 RepID=UPI00146BFBD9|nr:NAD(P)/FAD-dependent oxidoreductase [Pseudoflavitalea sp. G-6-1-2]NML20637.1 NAD(P)/FAD-dependent oxidoreductase [Pseudoflavitalea sp. G-6-1-2]